MNGIDEATGWSYEYDENVLTLSREPGSNVIAISAKAGAQNGKYKVIINAQENETDDEDGAYSFVEISVTVKNSEDDTELEITSVSPTSLTLKAGGDSGTVTATANKSQTLASWEVSSVEGVTSSISKLYNNFHCFKLGRCWDSFSYYHSYGHTRQHSYEEY